MIESKCLCAQNDNDDGEEITDPFLSLSNTHRHREREIKEKGHTGKRERAVSAAHLPPPLLPSKHALTPPPPLYICAHVLFLLRITSTFRSSKTTDDEEINV